MDEAIASLVCIITGLIIVVSGVTAMLHWRLPAPPIATLPPERRLLHRVARRFAIPYFIAFLVLIVFFVTQIVAQVQPRSWLQSLSAVVRGEAIAVCLLFAAHVVILLIDERSALRLPADPRLEILAPNERRRVIRFLAMRNLATRVASMIALVLASVALATSVSIQLGAAWGLALTLPMVFLCIGEVGARRLWYTAQLEAMHEPEEEADEMDE